MLFGRISCRLSRGGPPILYSLQPMNVFASQSVEQSITIVKSAGDKRIDNLFRRSMGRVAPDRCIIFRRLAIAELHTAVTCDVFHCHPGVELDANILRILSKLSPMRTACSSIFLSCLGHPPPGHNLLGYNPLG